ncbi:hypothetical protein EDD86DRAFT_273435 [Gorgonomyces haynaldii]|nr:hypothetical protein EDD86DRAFT_273435 [Gorgonomyces haynaldii]
MDASDLKPIDVTQVFEKVGGILASAKDLPSSPLDVKNAEKYAADMVGMLKDAVVPENSKESVFINGLKSMLVEPTVQQPTVQLSRVVADYLFAPDPDADFVPSDPPSFLSQDQWNAASQKSKQFQAFLNGILAGAGEEAEEKVVVDSVIKQVLHSEQPLEPALDLGHWFLNLLPNTFQAHQVNDKALQSTLDKFSKFIETKLLVDGIEHGLEQVEDAVTDFWGINNIPGALQRQMSGLLGKILVGEEPETIVPDVAPLTVIKANKVAEEFSQILKPTPTADVLSDIFKRVLVDDPSVNASESDEPQWSFNPANYLASMLASNDQDVKFDLPITGIFDLFKSFLVDEPQTSQEPKFVQQKAPKVSQKHSQPVVEKPVDVNPNVVSDFVGSFIASMAPEEPVLDTLEPEQDVIDKIFRGTKSPEVIKALQDVVSHMTVQEESKEDSGDLFVGISNKELLQELTKKHDTPDVLSVLKQLTGSILVEDEPSVEKVSQKRVHHEPTRASSKPSKQAEKDPLQLLVEQLKGMLADGGESLESLANDAPRVFKEDPLQAVTEQLKSFLADPESTETPVYESPKQAKQSTQDPLQLIADQLKGLLADGGESLSLESPDYGIASKINSLLSSLLPEETENYNPPPVEQQHEPKIERPRAQKTEPVKQRSESGWLKMFEQLLPEDQAAYDNTEFSWINNLIPTKEQPWLNLLADVLPSDEESTWFGSTKETPKQESGNLRCRNSYYGIDATHDAFCAASCKDGNYWSTNKRCQSPLQCKVAVFKSVPGTIANDAWCQQSCGAGEYCPCTLCECSLTCSAGVRNGDFQDNLAGWNVAAQADSKGIVAAVAPGTVVSQSGVRVPHRKSQRVAIIDSHGPGSYALYQSFKPSLGDRLVFKWAISNYAAQVHVKNSLSASVPLNQQFRVDILSAEALRSPEWLTSTSRFVVGSVLAPEKVAAIAAVVGPPPFEHIGPWQKYQFDLSEYAGTEIWR